MTFYDEKPKHDYAQIKERGGCLSVFLAFIVVANILVAGLTFVVFNELGQYGGADRGMASLLLGFSLVSVAAAIVCVWGLWNWKSWGYYGLMALYIIGIIVNLIMGSPQTIVGSALGMAILYALMRDKMHYLD